jgi:hypothetical protein
MWWTILTVVLVAVCVLLVLAGPIFTGRTSVGRAQEKEFRLWSGLWKRDDADRLR